jgi:hypothetical protein
MSLMMVNWNVVGFLEKQSLTSVKVEQRKEQSWGIKVLLHFARQREYHLFSHIRTETLV